MDSNFGFAIISYMYLFNPLVPQFSHWQISHRFCFYCCGWLPIFNNERKKLGEIKKSKVSIFLSESTDPRSRSLALDNLSQKQVEPFFTVCLSIMILSILTVVSASHWYPSWFPSMSFSLRGQTKPFWHQPEGSGSHNSSTASIYSVSPASSDMDKWCWSGPTVDLLEALVRCRWSWYFTCRSVLEGRVVRNKMLICLFPMWDSQQPHVLDPSSSTQQAQGCSVLAV